MYGTPFCRDTVSCATCHSPTKGFSDGMPTSKGIKGQRGGRNAPTVINTEGAFKTSTLRDIERTAPYMHDGSLKSLAEVIELYNTGGTPNPSQDPKITPLNLTEPEKADLLAFLRSLNGKPPLEAKDPRASTLNLPPDLFPFERGHGAPSSLALVTELAAAGVCPDLP